MKPEHLAEPGYRVAGLQRRAVVEVRCGPVIGELILELRGDEHETFVLGEHVQATGDKGRGDPVVVSQPADVVATCQVHALHEVPHNSDVVGRPMVADPRIVAREFPADLFGPVAGCVVGDDELDVAVLLVQGRTGSLDDRVLAVVDGQGYRNQGAGRRLHDQPSEGIRSSQISRQNGMNCRGQLAL